MTGLVPSCSMNRRQVYHRPRGSSTKTLTSSPTPVMFEGNKTAKAWSHVDSFAIFLASAVDTRQMQGSEEFISKIDCFTGTDQPFGNNFSRMSAPVFCATLTGVQPPDWSTTELAFARIRDCPLVWTFCCWTVSRAGAGTDCNNDVKAPERNSFKNSSNKSLSSFDWFCEVTGRMPAESRGRRKRGLTMHAKMQQRPHHKYNVQPMSPTRVSTENENIWNLLCLVCNY